MGQLGSLTWFSWSSYHPDIDTVTPLAKKGPSDAPCIHLPRTPSDLMGSRCSGYARWAQANGAPSFGFHPAKPVA